MNKLLKSKEVTIGLAVALFAAIGVIVYLTWFKEDYKPIQPNPQPGPPPMIAHPQPRPQPAMKNPSEIESVIGTGKPALVFFYADWCPHCKNAMPEWLKAADNLTQSGQFEAIPLKQETHGEEIAKHGVKAFPHYRLYPAGFPSADYVDYKGNRSATSLLKFVHSEGQDS